MPKVAKSKPSGHSKRLKRAAIARDSGIVILITTYGKMRAIHLLGVALRPSSLQPAIASVVEHFDHFSKRDNVLNMQYDPKNISTCTWRYDNHEGCTCKEIRDYKYAINPKDFSRRDPSITVDYENWLQILYCIQVKSEQKSPTATPTPSKITNPTTTPSATRKPELLGWTPLGYYVNDHTLRNLTTKEGGTSLTASKCEAAFKHVGTKAGTDCWCGAYVGNTWALD